MQLSIEGLVVRDRDAQAILTIDSLHMPKGTMLGVRGPSGAGKSTLLYALAGLLPRAEGQVLWGKTDLLTQGEKDGTAFRAAQIGMIFQDFLLFEDLSAQANADLVALFRPQQARTAIRAQARGSLSQLGVPDTARPVASFSGGERQRVAVARALAHDPAILLADEPTASLHRAAADALIDDLCDRVRDTGKTLIAVSHDPALLERMDRVLEIQDGRIDA